MSMPILYLWAVFHATDHEFCWLTCSALLGVDEMVLLWSRSFLWEIPGSGDEQFLYLFRDSHMWDTASWVWSCLLRHMNLRLLGETLRCTRLKHCHHCVDDTQLYIFSSLTMDSAFFLWSQRWLLGLGSMTKMALVSVATENTVS